MKSPAENVIEKCGGALAVAKICGIHVSRVYRWTHDRGKGGTGGVIPTRHQDLILQRARLSGIDLSPDDFFVLPVALPGTPASTEAA